MHGMTLQQCRGLISLLIRHLLIDLFIGQVQHGTIVWQILQSRLQSLFTERLIVLILFVLYAYSFIHFFVLYTHRTFFFLFSQTLIGVLSATLLADDIVQEVGRDLRPRGTEDVPLSDLDAFLAYHNELPVGYTCHSLRVCFFSSLFCYCFSFRFFYYFNVNRQRQTSLNQLENSLAVFIALPK